MTIVAILFAVGGYEGFMLPLASTVRGARRVPPYTAEPANIHPLTAICERSIGAVLRGPV
jgi:hypothetical protein